MNPHLFVYGTLRQNSLHPMADWLRGQSEFLGKGSLPGRKLDLAGGYSAAQFEEASGQFVEGDIFIMSDPAAMLAVLDKYEGIGGEFPEPQEYLRLEKPVRFQGGGLPCWVYLHNQPPAQKL